MDIGKDLQAAYDDGYTQAIIDIKLAHKPQTNADRIRSMTDEELAEFANAEGLSPWCGMHKECPQLENDPADCRPCALEWLKKEVEDGKET